MCYGILTRKCYRLTPIRRLKAMERARVYPQATLVLLVLRR